MLVTGIRKVASGIKTAQALDIIAKVRAKNAEIPKAILQRLVPRHDLICGLREVAKVAKTFGISAWPKLLASFATPKLSLEEALVLKLCFG